MSNDTPPRACLADLGFMTMVLDPDRPMSCSTNLNSGTWMFMLPELLAPQRFGAKNPTPTPQLDVYAFGLVIFQVFKDDEYLLSTYTVQVLTGETPFRDFGPIGCTPSIINGLRPDKPNNAQQLGFLILSGTSHNAVGMPIWNHDQELRRLLHYSVRRPPTGIGSWGLTSR